MNQSKIDKEKSAAKRNHVRAMIRKGLPNDVIRQEVLTYYGVQIPEETINTARKRMKKQEKRESVTTNVSGSKVESQVQIKNDGSNVVLEGSNFEGSQRQTRFKIPAYSIALEITYYVTVATACYGFTAAMPGVIGYAFAFVYGLLSFAAIQMVKDASIPKTAEAGRNMVYALEVLACVFAHYYTINRALWANLKALPFEVKYLPTGGTWIYNNGIQENGYWQNGETVFYLACVLSVILAVLAIVSIALRLELTKETKQRI